MDVEFNTRCQSEYYASIDVIDAETTGAMQPDLRERVAASLRRSARPEVAAFAAMLAGSRGDVRAVLFYGSNLRTGSLDGILDFYLLCDGEREHGIWPTVSYHEWDCGGTMLRAKVARMNLATFHVAAAGRLIDTTIWARFVQPSALVWQRDEASFVATAEAVSAAAVTAARLAVALGPIRARAEDYWRCLFRATYAAEFRVERAGREDTILAANRDHFAGLLPVALAWSGTDHAIEAQFVRPLLTKADKASLLRRWERSRKFGKLLNLVRLLRASTTFEGAGRYAAWKIERHTGVPVKLTPWQERHPVLAAPVVLWRVRREQRRGRKLQVASSLAG